MREEEGGPASPPPKQDPESLVLRARPRPVVRFRRGLIVGIAGATAAGLVGLAWTALEPPTFRVVAGEEQAEPFARTSPDALANAPGSYGEVPQLGPPLPGDLGRPILEHQRSLEAEPGSGAMSADAAAEARARAEAERQRRAEAREAARSSAVLVSLGGRQGSEQASSAIEPPRTSERLPGPSASGTAGGHQAGLTRPEPGEVSTDVLRPAPSPWTLSAGTIIPASLITGLNSDLPGMVIAQVTEPVRDSATGRTVLIPQGARLIGRYDNVVAFGQRRALLVWQRIVFPDGASIRLDNAPATDAGGYAGVEDQVDFHTWRLIKGIGLSTLLGVGTELSLGSSESDLVRAIRESTQQSAARAGDRITSRNLDVQPTLTVRPGWPLRAIIHKDLVLSPWRG
jgi:type IV secretion system protein TrbI